MGGVIRTISTKEDAETIREEVETFAADLWERDPNTGRTDWEAWLDRFERYADLDLGSDLLSPGITEIEKIARRTIREVVAD